MATINLGSIKFNWRGDYAAGTAYSVDDVVNSSGTSYICIAATTGNAPPNATYWNVMAQGGDVSTTLTTQGDILYRDGSGLARLGAGTSGQVLQTGGTGANPSWTTVSSDMVKLASYDITSATSEFNFVGFANDIYAYYRVQFSSLQGNSNNHRPQLRFINSSGTAVSDGDYTWLNTHPYSTGTPSINTHGSHSDTKFDFFDNGVGTGNSQYGFLEFAHEDLVNARQKPFIGFGASRESGGQVNVHIGGGQYRGNANCSGASGGFKIMNNGGDFTDGQITLYGFKK